eukprot:augustus_masked-scaffold_2-processed-gene-16.40-mRNA-1 protein AED:0.02 eAED:0.02 QI:0/-1/0/1/-1/1/1/0/518
MKYKWASAFLFKYIYIDCLSLSLAKRSIVKSKFESIFSKCNKGERLIVVFDNLDALVPNSFDNNYDPQTLWLVELLTTLIKSYRNLNNQSNTLSHLDNTGRDKGESVFIATGTQKDSIHPSLLEIDTFSAKIELNSLSVEERIEILSFFLGKADCVIDEIDDLALLLDGYQPGDIENLVEKGRLRYSEPSATDLIKVVEDFTPVNLANIATEKKGLGENVEWEDIGGLNLVKENLKEALEQPLIFSRLYKSLPIKNSSGLLLYGFPGGGKTLLAKALPKALPNLNFIFVKGPEVLDKYIGASEQNVRDLFGRAASAAPSVLFFDEFESLAPKRGADSTGVTDRVVNQLLTFLDGVEAEARDGVFVMAASSRPDMLDPALLRPGRLENHLLVDLPNDEERLDILRTLFKGQQSIVEGIDIKKLNGYSGADLKGIVSTAQVLAVKRFLKGKDSYEAGSKKVTISRADVEKAISESKPSISERERENFRQIYKRFSGEREADFESISGFDIGKGGERVALK